VITLTINGKTWQYDGDPQMPLLWFIRDIANLTGTKYGCGIAVCGACTVHVEGSAQRSCVLTMGAVDGKSVTTIEGLSDDASHPLQDSWREERVPQCGFCQAGQIMQAADLLQNNAKPSDADIDQAMQGNICRCGTYPRIRKAIKRAAVQYAGGES
jgi:isoquinoline 1-oxidoreductase alpha subunit